MINQPSEVTMMASLREVFTLFKEAANVSAPILNKVNIQPMTINIMVIIILMTSCQPVSIVGGQCDPSLYHDDASLSEILKKMRLFLLFHQDIQVLVNDKRSAPALHW